MKVLLDAHPAIQKKTGVGRYVDNLIKTLPKMDEKLDLCLYTHPPFPREYSKHPSFSAPFKNGAFRVFLGLPFAVNRQKPDLVHINNFAPIVKTCPLVMTVHDVCFKTCPQKYPVKTLAAFKLFFAMSLKKADAIVCVSETTKKQLLKHYKVDPKKVSVIYEAPDSRFSYISGKKRVKKYMKDKFDIEKEFFLVVGHIGIRKDPFLTIEAFKKIAKKRNVSLVFAGPNLLGNSVEKRYKDLIKRGDLRLLGYVKDKDLNYLLNGTLSLIYLSVCEGFGLPIVEAMTTKTPVICSDLPVFRELYQDNTMFVKGKKDLEKAMSRVIARGKGVEKYKKMGYKKAKEYSWGKSAKKTYKLYKKVLEKDERKRQI